MGIWGWPFRPFAPAVVLDRRRAYRGGGWTKDLIAHAKKLEVPFKGRWTTDELVEEFLRGGAGGKRP
jgi:hypothetical protein